MTKTHVIGWITGDPDVSGRGTDRYTKVEAEKVAKELDEQFPDLCFQAELADPNVRKELVE